MTRLFDLSGRTALVTGSAQTLDHRHYSSYTDSNPIQQN